LLPLQELFPLPYKLVTMTFSIIDSEGATIATFEDAKEARAFARASLRDDSAAGADLAVIEYDDEGRRVSDAVLIGDFLRQRDRTTAVLLRLIVEQGPMTMVQIAEQMNVQTGTVEAVATTVRARQRALNETDLVAAIRRDRRSLTAA
jgi:hypothetical protein